MAENERSMLIRDLRRVTVKVGTSSITRPSGELDIRRMEKIVSEIVEVIESGIEVVLVSSGAIGAGIGRLGLTQKPQSYPEKQAAAAVGQGILLQTYEQLFDSYNRIVAQVLLTRSDIAARSRYLNARNTLITLLKYGVIPIINENDTVAFEEIRLGDNDRLSALTACLVDSDLLVILSDIDGVYSSDPKNSSNAYLIHTIEDLGPEIEQIAGGSGSKFGTGGMVTKIQAARIATSSGIPMIVANASHPSILQRIVGGEEVGTLFLPGKHKLHTKKRWIGFGSDTEGKLFVDPGAEEALVNAGKSLLPSGVVRIEGSFRVGSVVSVIGEGDREIARGIVGYSSSEIEKIKGRHTDEIEKILGYKTFTEIIHRDNLTVIV